MHLPSFKHKPNVKQKVKRKLHRPTWAKVRHLVLRQSMVILGAVIAGLGFTLFLVPYKLTAGGVSGLAIIVNEFIPVPVGTTIFLLNVPLLVWGYFALGGMRFVLSTILAVAVFSFSSDFFIYYLPKVLDVFPITDDLLLAAIYAGVLFGVGSGIIYRAGSSIGGTSIPARIINDRTGFPLSQTYLYTDMAVILLGGVVFNWEVAMLALLALMLTGIVSDYVVEGASQVRTAVVITAKPEQMSYAIAHELRRGLSLWTVTGGFSQTERTMIYCTVRRSKIYDLKYVVSRIDPDALLIIGVAQQAWGGYGNLKMKASEL